MEDNEQNRRGGVKNCAVWDFRANEDVFTSLTLQDFFKANCKKWVFQKERGDTGYIHWQGRFSLIKKRTPGPLLRLFDLINGRPNYLEPTATHNHQDEFFYALKEDTRIEGPYMDAQHQSRFSSSNPYIQKRFINKQPYPWQNAIIQSNQLNDDRGVNVIVDFGGGIGKSWIASYCQLFHGAVRLPILDTAKELVSATCNIFTDKNIHDQRLLFVDMPRAMKKNELNSFYTAIEIIKEGYLNDPRNHFKEWWTEPPIIWVFTNTMPDIHLLSFNRWKFWFVDDNKQLKKLNINDLENLKNRHLTSFLDSPTISDEIQIIHDYKQANE